MIAIVVAVVLVAIAGAAALAVLLRPSPYSATLKASSAETFTWYQGQVPVNNVFLVVNATVNDTGSVAVSPSSQDWSVIDSNGFSLAYADNLFYGSEVVPAGSSLAVHLVFDLMSSSSPAKLVIELPNQAQVATPLPAPHYSATIAVVSNAPLTSYEGQTPARAYFLIVNLTANNTGSAVLTPTYLDWTVTDANGSYEGFAEQSFYGNAAIQPNGGGKVTVVFDLTQYDSPAKVFLEEPDGSRVAAPLVPGPPKPIVTLGGTTKVDTVTWAFAVASASPAVAPSYYKVNFAIGSLTGAAQSMRASGVNVTVFVTGATPDSVSITWTDIGGDGVVNAGDGFTIRFASPPASGTSLTFYLLYYDGSSIQSRYWQA